MLGKMNNTKDYESIAKLLDTEQSLRASGASIKIAITKDYSYSSIRELSVEQRVILAPLIEQTQADGFVLPRTEANFSIIPIRGRLSALLEKASHGVSWHEAEAAVSEKDLGRLCVLGILGIKLMRGIIGGPAAQLLIKSKRSGVLPHERTTDPLSAAAIAYAARLPVANSLILMSKLYCYNSELPSRSALLSDCVRDVHQFIQVAVGDHFLAKPASAGNEGWHMFTPVRPPERPSCTPRSVKLYISPVIEDLPRCLAQLTHILPRLPLRAWKIGRFSYGITRPDKICVYFSSIEEAHDAARTLIEGLKGIRAQGVPFTQRQDSTGLVSLGFDPNRQDILADLGMQNSWRLWVARKLATALILAKRDPAYPLSPEQSSLWALHFLGIEPETWTVYDFDFWRN